MYSSNCHNDSNVTDAPNLDDHSPSTQISLSLSRSVCAFAWHNQLEKRAIAQIAYTFSVSLRSPCLLYTTDPTRIPSSFLRNRIASTYKDRLISQQNHNETINTICPVCAPYTDIFSVPRIIRSVAVDQSRLEVETKRSSLNRSSRPHDVYTMKMNSALFLIGVATLLNLATATDVKPCPKSKAKALSAEEVTISNCPKNKCILKRNTEASITMKIKPERDFNDLTSDIQGIILDVPLPFPGYYGTSACPHIYDATGENKVGCPLKAGETYIYKNSFKILPVYPTVSLEIHWGLGDKQGDAACFQIPAKIKA